MNALFAQMPGLKKQLWGSAFWSSGFYVSTVGRHGNESSASRYIAGQGFPEYEPFYEGQMSLFDPPESR